MKYSSKCERYKMDNKQTRFLCKFWNLFKQHWNEYILVEPSNTYQPLETYQDFQDTQTETEDTKFETEKITSRRF